MSTTVSSTATADGVVTRAQVDFDALADGPWDGRRLSYIPNEPLQLGAGIDLHGDFEPDIDPITYQVLRSRFWHMNLEHGDIIKRISGSPVVVHANDFAVSMLTETGDVVVCGPTIQYFTALSDLVVKWTLENRDEIEEGDVFLQNDPFIGTAHQPDTSVYAPVFWDGKIFSWIYSCAHTGDLGGVDPGGWAIHARDIFDEAVTIPPIKIAPRGQLDMSLVEMFARQSRVSSMITLNTKSQFAGIQGVRRTMTEALERYGPEVVKGVMRKMIADCSKVVSERLLRIPDGTWRQQLHLTGALGEAADRTTIREVISLTKRGDQIVCTNAGTSEQGGPGNATYATFRSNVVAALQTGVAWDQLGCTAGVANHVSFEPVPGTRNVATHPAACSAIISTINNANAAGLAVSKMLMSGPPDLRAHANSSGGLSVPLMDLLIGIDGDGNFVGITPSIAALGGCIGAFPYRDGIDTGGSWYLLGTTAGNVEESETNGVVLILFRGGLPDSGGAGRWRGGNGAGAVYVKHKVETLTIQMQYVDPGANVASGLGGGYYGLAGNFMRVGDPSLGEHLAAGRMPRDRAELERLVGSLERLHPQRTLPSVEAGECIVMEHNGGGGFGDPLEREPERVLADVLEQRVSIGAADRHWGVVIGDEAVDEAATASRREAMRSDRLAQADPPDGARQGRLEGAETAVAGAAGGVDVLRAADGTLAWACSCCGEGLGPASATFKHAAARRESAPQDVDPYLYPDPSEFGDAEIVLRQYYCPGCATLLAQDFCRRGDEPFSDFEIHDAGAAESRPAN